MKVRFYKGKDGQWNNRILLDAGGYNTKRNAVNSLKAVLKYAVAGDFKIA